MVLMAGMDLPVSAIREQVSSAIDLIVQEARFKDGSRRITHLTEVVGLQGDVISVQDIFGFDYDEIAGAVGKSAAKSAARTAKTAARTGATAARKPATAKAAAARGKSKG